MGNPGSVEGTDGGIGGGTGGGGGFESGLLLEAPGICCRKLPLFSTACGCNLSLILEWRWLPLGSLVMTPCPTKSSERSSVLI